LWRVICSIAERVYIQKPWRKDKEQDERNDNEFAKRMLGKKMAVHKKEDHLNDKRKEKEIVREDTKYVHYEIADPCIAVMLFEDHDKEILTQDCSQGKQTVHTDFIAVPVHERGNSNQDSSKDADRGSEGSFADEIDSRNRNAEENK
jgi:hypothetical protein